VPPPPAHSPSALRFDDNPQLGAFISPSAAAAHVSPKNLPPSAAPRPSSGNKRFLYGTPLEDMLESVLLERTALLPGTRVDARNMRVIATLLRHSPPITMPGNFEEQWQLQEARIASRRADAGVDEHAVERDVDRRLETLSTRLRTLTKDAKWRTNDADHTLHTFVLVAAMFSADSAVDNLCADIERHVLPLAAYYLLHAKQNLDPLDPVARFHLKNGARLERINWPGDTSSSGFERSAGVTANYVYKLADVERNHELIVREHKVPASREIEALAKRFSPPARF